MKTYVDKLLKDNRWSFTENKYNRWLEFSGRRGEGVRGTITVSQSKTSLINDDMKSRINWSAIGSVEPNEAQEFSELIQHCVNVARIWDEEMNQGDA